MKLHTINTGYFKLDGGAMYGVVPKSLWNKVNPSDESNMCTWAMRCLLIENNNRLILIDTGIGDKQDEKFFSHFHPHGEDSLEKSLALNGITPSDITDVFLTHLHFDHCGGAIKRVGDKFVPAFKNAMYWSNQMHWNSAVNPNDREKASFLKENILPIKESGQLNFINVSDGEEWTKGISVHYVHGHTESMMLPKIDYKDKTILYCADLIPSTGHISIPWVMAYDMRPLDTLNEKRKLLSDGVKNKWILFFEHDPITECCSLEQTDKGPRIKNKFKLDEIF